MKSCYNHNQPGICVPPHISIYGVYSAHFFLLSSMVNMYHHYYWMFGTQFILYITTILHWRKVYFSSIYKTIDMIAAVTALINGLYETFNLPPTYKWLYIYYALFMTGVFCINETIFYFQAKRPCQTIMTDYYKWFSLKYTTQNTSFREKAYYRVVYTHILFLHLLSSFVSMICISQNSRRNLPMQLTQ